MVTVHWIGHHPRTPLALTFCLTHAVIIWATLPCLSSLKTASLTQNFWSLTCNQSDRDCHEIHGQLIACWKYFFVFWTLGKTFGVYELFFVTTFLLVWISSDYFESLLLPQLQRNFKLTTRSNRMKFRQRFCSIPWQDTQWTAASTAKNLALSMWIETFLSIFKRDTR